MSKRLEHVGQTILTKRKEKEISQKDLAEIIGTSPTSMGKYERGEAIPDVKTMVELADFFDMSLDDLCGRSKRNMNNINTLGDVIRILGRLNKVVDLKPINDSTRTDTQTWCILEFKCSDDEYREKLHSSLQNYIEAMSTLKNIEPSIRDEMVNLYSKNKLKEYDNLIIK